VIVKKKALLVGFLFVTLAILGGLIALDKAREEISVSISREAFLGPQPNTPLIQRRNNHSQNSFILSMTLTPAPWPKGAQVIWDGTSRGRVVHVTVIDVKGTPKFDVKRASSGGGLEVWFNSLTEAENMAKALGIDVEEKIFDRAAGTR
jgi:hypothetical protein